MLSRDLRRRYRLGPEIGRGSIGIIHRAEDLVLERTVAVKILRPELRDQERQRTRFLREARICARLSHPNIVPVYDVGELEEGPCLVMALLAGRSLRTLIRNTILRPARMLSAFTQVCQAVAFAHDQGIIHRDIKPAHVFLGDFGQVVLTDWGLAKSLRAPVSDDVSSATDEVTRMGDIVGTPAYMAPEQAEGRVRAVDHRADIYALGAVLYEILTGTRPYESSRSADVLREVRLGAPEPPSKRAPHRAIPAALEAVCQRAMARDPGDRFASALDFAANIDALFEQRETAPEPDETRLFARPPPPSEQEKTAPSMEDAAAALADGHADAAAYERQLVESRAHAAEAARLGANLPADPGRRAFEDVWRLQARARDALDRAAWHFAQAVERLETAAHAPPQMVAARAALARLHRDAWRTAEDAGDPVSAAYHRGRAEAMDDGTLAAELALRSTLTVHSSPNGAAVDLSSLDDRGPMWSAGARLRLGQTPLLRRTVSAARVHVRLTAPDGLVARVPLRLMPGDSRVVEVTFPPSRLIPPGFVFVPGGRFVLGGDDLAPGARAPREVEVTSFAMARLPITWDAYFEFLEDLLAVGADASQHLPRRGGEALVRVEDRAVRWRDDVHAASGAPVRFVSHADARAYAEWLGRRLGATLRLPSEEEWEYAAGASDGRSFPWGGRFAPGICDSRWRKTRGPVALGEFPDDESPFGIRSMGGGVGEWTLTPADEPGRYLIRGGSWRARPDQCRVAARATGAGELTHEAIGIRLACDFQLQSSTPPS